MTKALIADDQELTRQSLQIVLNNRLGIMVTDVASSGQGVIRSVRKNKPDIILMNIRMSRLDDVQCMKTIKENYPWIKTIILTTFDDNEYIYNVLKYGVSGYLLGGVSMDELANTTTTAHNRWAMANPDIATRVLRPFLQMTQADYTALVGDKNMDELTKTGWKIIAQVEKGASNREIAEALKPPEGTARDYLSTILSKLGLRDRTQLAIQAAQINVRKRLGT